MGRRVVELTVSATLSDHNSDEDKTDQALWDLLRDHLKVAVSDPVYEPISVMVSG